MNWLLEFTRVGPDKTCRGDDAFDGDADEETGVEGEFGVEKAIAKGEDIAVFCCFAALALYWKSAQTRKKAQIAERYFRPLSFASGDVDFGFVLLYD